MPIYEYVCLNDSCGKVNELIQKVGDPAPASCDFCGGSELVKKTSLPSFHLKGGGWYKDGYGNRAEEAPAKPETADKPDSKEKTDSKDKKETTDSSVSKDGKEPTTQAASAKTEKQAAASSGKSQGDDSTHAA